LGVDSKTLIRRSAINFYFILHPN